MEAEGKNGMEEREREGEGGRRARWTRRKRRRRRRRGGGQDHPLRGVVSESEASGGERKERKHRNDISSLARQGKEFPPTVCFHGLPLFCCGKGTARHSAKAQAIYLHNSARGVPEANLETLRVMILLLCSALQLTELTFICLKYFVQNVYASFKQNFIELAAK